MVEPPRDNEPAESTSHWLDEGSLTGSSPLGTLGEPLGVCSVLLSGYLFSMCVSLASAHSHADYGVLRSPRVGSLGGVLRQRFVRESMEDEGSGRLDEIERSLMEAGVQTMKACDRH